MKKNALKIKTAQLKGWSLYHKLRIQEEAIFNLIKPHINNDMEHLHDDDIVVDFLAGDGFALMMNDRGISVDDMISRISELKDGEKINLSELPTYL